MTPDTSAPAQGVVPVPLSGVHFDGREEELVLEVLRSGRLSLGPTIDRFEQLIAERVGAPFAAAVSSGTAGLHMLAHIRGLGPGDEVITSPISFVASANCFIFEGATPVFAEVDPQTLNLDPAAVEVAITERTKAIVAVDMFGYPCELDELKAISDRHELALIEDSAEALGAEYRGRPLGSHGPPAVFGFYPNKQMTTGEGGVVVTHSEEEWQLLPAACETRAARTETAAGLTMSGSASTTAASTSRRRSASPSSEARRDPQLRAAAAARYTSLLDALDGIETPLADDDVHRRSWFVYVIRLAAGIDRDAVMASMREQGISTAEYVPCVHLQPYLGSATASRRGCARSRRQLPLARSPCRSGQASSRPSRSASSRRCRPPWRDDQPLPTGVRGARGAGGLQVTCAMLAHEAGAERIGLSLWEVPPGDAAYPYHYHLGDEELLIVLEGSGRLRTPDGWRDLVRGEVISFLPGEAGAHQLVATGDEPLRFSRCRRQVIPTLPSIRIRTRWPPRSVAPAGSGSVRLGDAVDYWVAEIPRLARNNSHMADFAPKMVFLGYGKYARADQDLRPRADHRPAARWREPNAGVGRGDRGADRRLTHGAYDPPRHGSGRGPRHAASGRRARPCRASRRAGRVRSRRPRRSRPPGAPAARVDGATRRLPAALLSAIRQDFFARSVHEVAPELVGATLLVDGVGGAIVEVEAYDPDDPASHAYRGRTPRNAAMFGPPGHAYVYRSYGVHWCLNLVCGAEGVGEAVLVRAVAPTYGIDVMRSRRGVEADRLLCSGPGRLCQALAVSIAHDGLPLDAPPFELRPVAGEVAIVTDRRIGLTRAVEREWRYGLAGSPFLSRPFRTVVVPMRPASPG